MAEINDWEPLDDWQPVNKAAAPLTSGQTAANARAAAGEDRQVSSYFKGFSPLEDIARGGAQLLAYGADKILPEPEPTERFPERTYSERLSSLLKGADKVAYGDETDRERSARGVGSFVANTVATLPLMGAGNLLRAPAATTAVNATRAQRVATALQNAARATPAAIANRAPGAAVAGMALPADSGEGVLANMGMSAGLNVAAPAVLGAIGSGAKGVGRYVFQGRDARGASEALRLKTASAVSDAAANPTSPALEARQAQYVLAQNETAASRAAEEAARKNAAALQAMEGKRVIQPIGEPATREAIGAAPQAEMLGAKAAQKKAANKAWKETTEEVDKIDASKQGFGTRIAYTKPFKDFIASATKEANASVGNPQTKAFYSKILEWFPEGNVNAIKPSQLMELKRFVAETAFDPTSGFKAIAKERSKKLFNQIDNILDKHLTDPKTGATPYKDRNDAYARYKKAWEKDYLSRYGKKFTAQNIFGDAVSSGTDVAKTLFSGDPAAMRAAISQGAKIPTLLKSTASNMANEFEGKSVDEIVKMLKPGSPLMNTLNGVKQLAPLRNASKRYLQDIMDQSQNSLKISSFNKIADDFAKAAEKSETAAVRAQGRVTAGKQTLQENLEAFSGDLGRAKDNPAEIVKLARKHFARNQPMLDEILQIEKKNLSADKLRGIIRGLAIATAGGGAAGAGIKLMSGD
jgi:hypothetical protein